MKRFNTIVNNQLLKLLEALPQDGGPVLDQDPSAPDEPARSTPQEKTNWEITLLDLAKTAIYNVKSNPESVTPEDEEKLTLDVTAENKDEMLDILYRLAGKEKAPAMPIPSPEEQPEPEQGAEPAPEPGGATAAVTNTPPGGRSAANKAAKASRPI